MLVFLYRSGPHHPVQSFPTRRSSDLMKSRIESSPCKQFCYKFLGGFEHARKFHQVFEFLDKSHSLDKILERSEEHTSELQSPCNLVCRLLLEKKKNNT